MTLTEWKSSQAMTVSTLADLCGVGRVSMHRIMSGERMPRPPTVARIESATAGAVTWRDLQDAYKARRAAR